jgi:hypothetical protein
LGLFWTDGPFNRRGARRIIEGSLYPPREGEFVIGAEVRETLRVQLARGASLDHVDRFVIDRLRADEDERAAAWLYAWCCSDDPELARRREYTEPAAFGG